MLCPLFFFTVCFDLYQKDLEDKIHVLFILLFVILFAGEQQNSIFGRVDLRHSQEWLGSRWTHLKQRLDVVNSILSSLGTKQVVERTPHLCNEVECSESLPNSGDTKVKNAHHARDLLKDELLTHLRWNSSKKRKRSGRSSILKLCRRDHDSENAPGAVGSGNRERPLMPTSIKVDHDNCKYIRDSFFSPAIVSPLSNLVMSR